MDAVERKSDAQIRNLVFVANGGCGGVEVGAGAAKIGHDSLGREGLQARHGLGGIRLVVEHGQFDLQLLAADGYAAGRVDMLHGNLVAGLDLTAERRVTPGQRHDRTNLDSLAVAFRA